MKIITTGLMSCFWSLTSLAATTATVVDIPSSSSSSTPSSNPVNTSTATTSIGTSMRRTLPLSIAGTSFFYGPPVTAPTRSSTTAFTKGGVWGLSLQNQIAAKYSLTSDLSITPVFDFVYQLTDPTNGGAYRRVSMMYDSFIKVAKAGLFRGKLFGQKASLDCDTRIFVPTSESSRENGTRGSVRMSVIPSIELNRSNFSLSMVNHARYWIQSNDRQALDHLATLPRLQLYTGPQLNYQFAPQITAWILYEATVVVDTAGIPNTRNSNRSLADVEPGVDIKINDRVSVTPYLNWYTNQPLSTTSMNLNANIVML